jgi:hypothetical protein
MDSKAFHICPFCQAPSSVSDTRCARCHRSLAGLPLPVYGAEIDEALSGRGPQPLVDLPLREEAAVVPAPPPAAEAPAPAAPIRRTRPVTERRGMGRGAKIGLASAIMGTALIGGWLVRAQDRNEPPRAEGGVAPQVERSSAPVAPVVAAPPMTTPPATVSAAAAKSTSVAAARTRATTVPRIPPALPTAQPAASAEEASPASSVDAPPSAGRRASRRPAAEPIKDEGPEPPDFEPDPVEAGRAGDRARRDPVPADTVDDDARGAGGRASVAERLQRAEQRRDALAARVSRLRARANASVVTDVAEYQRVQAELEALLEQQDRLDAQVARLRRALERRRE